MTNRHWVMRQGSVDLSIESTLNLQAASQEVRSNGGSLLFTIEETSRSPLEEMPAVIHIGRAADEIPHADYLPRQRQLHLWANDGELTGVDLLFLSYLLLEAQLQRLGLVTLHAAAVEREGVAALLLGQTGAGKTTTAISLCRQFGCRLIGNDLVVAGGLGQPIAVCGTTHVRLRYSSIARVMPDLMHLLSTDPEDPWRYKVDVTAERLGIAVSDRPSEIVAVVFVHVDSDYSQPVLAEGDTSIHRLNLYENALRYIRATNTPWSIGSERAFGPFVPSFDDPTAHQARTATLNHLLGRSHYVAGSLGSVATCVSDLLQARSPREPREYI